MKEKIIFFGVFYIILGTLGLTIPSISYYLTNHRWPLDDISIGLITIVVSTVGYSTAEKIIDYRNKNGKFSSIEDIQNVKGIGNAKYENIKESICVK